MKRIRNIAFIIISFAIVIFSYNFCVLASQIESSQFTLFASERNLSLEKQTGEAPADLNNVKIDEIPSSLKDSFDRLGQWKFDLLTDEHGNTKLKTEDIDKFTFTGPYYVFSKTIITEGLDIDEFRQSFSYEPILAYIIRFGEQAVGTFYVTYSGGKYEYGYASSSIDAENMLSEINSLSSDLNQPANDIVFISIGSARYAFGKNDMVKTTSLLTPEPVSFYDLVKAYYVSETEMKALIAANNGDNSFCGGGGAAEYLYDADEYIKKYEAKKGTVNYNETFQTLVSSSNMPYAFGLGSTFLVLVATAVFIKFRK